MSDEENAEAAEAQNAPGGSKTSAIVAGANPVHVKAAMGHADLRTTMAYTRLRKEHLRALVAPITTPATAEKQA